MGKLMGLMLGLAATMMVVNYLQIGGPGSEWGFVMLMTMMFAGMWLGDRLVDAKK